MRNSLLYISTFLVGSILLSSCKKKKEEPEPDPNPVIEFVSVSPTNMVQFQDSIVLKLKYKDTNGDLGDMDPDVRSLYVKDARLSKADYFHVKPLAPVSSENIPIEGELTIKLNTLFLLGTGNSELTTLTIKLTDRAGHTSNEITSSQITINKQ